MRFLNGFFEAHRHHIPRIGRVMSVGAVGFIIQTALFEILGIRLAFVAASTAAIIGGECAILSNFFLNNRFSFREAAEVPVPLWRRLVRFHMVSSGSLIMQWVSVFLAESVTQEHMFLRLAYVCGVGVGFLINYSGYYFYVWRKHES